MAEKKKDMEIADQTLELASQALLTEYKAIREASLSRDERKGTLENFMIVVLSVAVAGLPTIIAEQQYLLLPTMSLMVSAIALAHRVQGWLANELALYESEVLRPQLLRIFRHTYPSKHLPEVTDRLWQWQSYLWQKRSRGSLVVRFLRRLAHIDLGSLFTLASIGFLLLFIHYRGLVNSTTPELAVFVLAALSSLWLVTIYVRAVIVDMASLIRRR